MENMLIYLLFCGAIATAVIVALKKYKVTNWVTGGAEAEPLHPYSSKRMMNRGEFRLFSIIDKWRREKARDLSLSAQVSYGSFIRNDDIRKWRDIASLRADFVLVGQDGYVKAIIEFDGEGHYGDNVVQAAKVEDRDLRKNTAAVESGISLLRIPAQASVIEIRECLDRELLVDAKPVVVTAPEDRVIHRKV